MDKSDLMLRMLQRFGAEKILEFNARLEEVTRLYEVTDAEQVIVNQMSSILRMQYPSVTTEQMVRYIRILLAQDEVIFDCLYKDMKK